MRAGARAWGRRAAATVALYALASLPPVARAQPSSAGQELSIEAPAELTLGASRPIDIVYTAPADLNVRLLVNVGTLGAPVRVAPDRYRIRYTPPTQKYPQVAIVALLASDGSRYAWRQLRLLGSARIAIQSDPGVEVSVRVAGRMFGPVRTDGGGLATVPVVIPPGITQAQSVAVDSLGNRTESATRVDVPEFGRVLSACAAERSDAFWVFAVDQRGQPLPKAALELSAGTLRVRASTALAPGVYRAELEFPSGVSHGDRLQVRAALDKRDRYASSCELQVPQARARGIELHAPAELSADAERPVRVRLVPKYVGGGGAPEPIDIALSVDLGELSRRSILTAAEAELVWNLPRRFEPGRKATLIARASGLEARAVIVLRPGQVHALELSTEAPRAGGGDATFVVLARDRHGNPVRDVALRATARGQLGAFELGEAGRYRASYTAPQGTDKYDRVVVRTEPSGVHASIVLGELHWLQDVFFGACAGYLTNFARVSGPFVLAQVGMRLPIRALRIDVGLDGGWYSSHHEEDDGATQTEVQAVPLFARADYVIDLQPWQLRIYVGPGVMLTRAEVEAVGSGRTSTSQVSPLVAAGGAVALAAGPGRIVLELGYWYAPVSTDNVEGNAGGASASLGFLAEL